HAVAPWGARCITNIVHKLCDCRATCVSVEFTHTITRRENDHSIPPHRRQRHRLLGSQTQQRLPQSPIQQPRSPIHHRKRRKVRQPRQHHRRIRARQTRRGHVCRNGRTEAETKTVARILGKGSTHNMDYGQMVARRRAKVKAQAKKGAGTNAPPAEKKTKKTSKPPAVTYYPDLPELDDDRDKVKDIDWNDPGTTRLAEELYHRVRDG